MTKQTLWGTNEDALHPLVANYTVGNDIMYDLKLLGYDISATQAHCKMLHSVGLLTKQEYLQLHNALTTLQQEWSTGVFSLNASHEDGHTAIEHYLTSKLGQTGKKVHTARSRNDQVMVMMRLYIKDAT